MRLWILIFVAVAFCLTFAAYGLTAPMEGLVLYLTFDEGQGDTAEDLSGEGNDGFFVGDPKWVKGKFGMALQFSRPSP